MAKHEHEEFRSEHPATEERTLFKTGAKVDEDGAYVCINCVNVEKPPMVNLHKGDMVPVCGSCGPLSRWSKI